MATIDWGQLVTAAGKAEQAAQQLRDAVARAVQSHLDAVARERDYDGIASLCSYAGDPNPQFAAEGAAGVAWRSAVWSVIARIEADVRAGLRPAPSPEAVLPELPEIVWPT